MHSDEASTPAPTYGTSSSSSAPWTVPSSPNGPCRTGNTASTPSSPSPGRRPSGSPPGRRPGGPPVGPPRAGALDQPRHAVGPRRGHAGRHGLGGGERDLVLG